MTLPIALLGIRFHVEWTIQLQSCGARLKELLEQHVPCLFIVLAARCHLWTWQIQLRLYKQRQLVRALLEEHTIACIRVPAHQIVHQQFVILKEAF